MCLCVCVRVRLFVCSCGCFDCVVLVGLSVLFVLLRVSVFCDFIMSACLP